MAQSKDQIKATYPLPVYNYRVTLQRAGDSQTLSFGEVSGLSLEYEPVIYKHGLSFVLGDMILAGMRQPVRLTLKRGIAPSRSDLYSWINSTYSDPDYASAQRDILIDLCDEAGVAVIRWLVQSALPIKLDAPTFDAKANEVAIESLELIAVGLQVDYNP
jgi:phage tail-like protein